jgi:hypothetical protein
MPFVKGQSGNPAGRPVGSRNKFTSDMQDALEGSGLPLIQRLLELAGEGNTGAMRACLDRLMGRHRPCAVALPAPDSPNYVMEALTEIHRALGAGEIASDEASRLVDFVGRTARVLAAKAVAEIDFADRLARVEETLGLLEAGQPDAGPAGPSPEVKSEGVIDNNNAETMTPASTAAAEPVPAAPLAVAGNNEDPRVAAALDKAVQAALADVRPRRRMSVKEQLMNSVSPSALLVGEVTEKVLAGKTESVMPPLAPPARAA